MATFRRRGHYRRGRGGTLHWVSAHSVTRDGRTVPSTRFSSAQRISTPKARSKPRSARPSPQPQVIMTPPVPWKFPLDEPNSRCPKCLQPVWFFRNRRGGCAYFDAVGKPWPLHPCMEPWMTSEDARAVQQAISSYERSVGTGIAPSRQPADDIRAHEGGSREVRSTPANVASSAQIPHQWIALSGLLASLGSLPVAVWAFSASEGGPVLPRLWMMVVPVIVMPIALGLFIQCVPRQRFDGGSWAAAVAVSPPLMIAGILVNFFTIGFALPALAALLTHRAKRARDRRGSRSSTRATEPPDPVPPVVTDQ